MSAADYTSEWNFRKTDQRLIVVKGKSEVVHKASVLDVLTQLSIAVEVPESIPMEKLELQKQFLAEIQIFTSKNLEGIKGEFVEFFDALDIDQASEDFIKAYWVYPTKIRFTLQSIEEP